MPRNRDERARVLGPYYIKAKEQWQAKVLIPTATDRKRRRVIRYFDDEQEANEWVAEARSKLPRLEGVTVKVALEAHRLAMIESGDYKAASAKESCRRIGLLMGDPDQRLSRITDEKAKALYKAFVARGYYVGPKKARRWKPYTTEHHRNVLAQARTFGRWCVKQGWIDVSPLEDVVGIGERSAGKPQLTGDEATKFYEWCLWKARRGDEAAMALLLLLLLALRQSDVIKRQIRDVDLGATVLRVTGGKTKKSNRPRNIPDDLQPIMERHVKGKESTAPLFATEEGGYRTDSWLRLAMKRFCRDAGVPYVCPHSLKGTAGTTLADDGEAGNRIAAHLSHRKETTSERHYVRAGAIEDAQLARGLVAIRGGRR